MPSIILCSSVPSVPGTFAEAQLKQYWHKDFEESETQKGPLEDTH